MSLWQSIGIGQVLANFRITYIGIGSASKSGIGASLMSTPSVLSHANGDLSPSATTIN